MEPPDGWWRRFWRSGADRWMIWVLSGSVDPREATPVGRPCLACGYDLEGLIPCQPCPECGRAVDPDEVAAIARRRRALVLCSTALFWAPILLVVSLFLASGTGALSGYVIGYWGAAVLFDCFVSILLVSTFGLLTTWIATRQYPLLERRVVRAAWHLSIMPLAVLLAVISTAVAGVARAVHDSHELWAFVPLTVLGVLAAWRPASVLARRAIEWRCGQRTTAIGVSRDRWLLSVLGYGAVVTGLSAIARTVGVLVHWLIESA